jgi:hypothetical protein
MATNATEPLLLYLGLLTSKMETGGSKMGSTGATYGPGSSPPRAAVAHDVLDPLLTVYFGAPSMFITLWFGFDYGTNPPLGTLII